MINTAVAFFIFKRPDLTRRVFEVIKQVKPNKLLVVADGPHSMEDQGNCQEARAIVKDIDWPCQLLTNFSDVNMGCKRRISSGLDWVFSEVDEVIIIEDDCLPTLEFFDFCEQMLERYRHDERVMLIDGSQINDGIVRKDSYYFSKYAAIWGWASWRRAWKHYDVDMKTWPNFKRSQEFKNLFSDIFERLFWINILDKVYNGKIDTWDYQLNYALMKHNGVSVTPRVNMVKNIGFGQAATHTFAQTALANLPVDTLGKIKPPAEIKSDVAYDKYVFDHFYGGNRMKASLKWRLMAWLS